MKAVAIYRSEFLAVSETFIGDHIRALSRYSPEVLCQSEIISSNRPEISVASVGRGKIAPRLFRRFGYSRPLSMALKRSDVRLAHAHFLPDGEAILPFCRRHRLPLVVTAHGYDATKHDIDHGTKRRQELIAYSSAIICVSDFIRDALLEQGYPSEKLVMLPLGIDADLFDFQEQEQKTGICSIGRMVEKKGTEYLLRAYALLPAPLRETHPLTIVGDGPLLPHLQAVAGQLGIDVNFLGAQPRAVGLDLLGRSRIFCLPSVRATDGDAEGMPIAIMEAMALGAPALFFQSQHMSGKIHQAGGGVASAYKDVHCLARDMELLLSSDSHARNVAVGGRRFFEEHFSLKQNVSKLEHLYDEIARC